MSGGKGRVGWIRLAVDFFDSPLIRVLLSKPDGECMALLLLRLQCLAGALNDRGRIRFGGDEALFLAAHLSTLLGWEQGRIERAFETLKGLGLLALDSDSVWRVTGWEDDQNVEGLEKLRERNREYQRVYRAKRKGGKAADVVATENTTGSEGVSNESEFQRYIRERGGQGGDDAQCETAGVLRDAGGKTVSELADMLAESHEDFARVPRQSMLEAIARELAAHKKLDVAATISRMRLRVAGAVLDKPMSCFLNHCEHDVRALEGKSVSGGRVGVAQYTDVPLKEYVLLEDR